MSDAEFIRPTWPAPAHVLAFASDRQLSLGHSEGPYQGLNLGSHVGDAAERVLKNRETLALAGHLPQPPYYLQQVHGTRVVDLDDNRQLDLVADAAFTTRPNTVCAVMTADCLPVLFCDLAGTQVAAAHAGWRGLCDGVLEQVMAKFRSPSEVMCWLGPAIGPAAFEVGDEVRQAFVAQQAEAEQAFRPTSSGKYLADLYLLARLRLARLGVHAVYGGDYCTYSDSTRFYSYRRDGQTGRQVSLIWLGA